MGHSVYHSYSLCVIVYTCTVHVCVCLCVSLVPGAVASDILEMNISFQCVYALVILSVPVHVGRRDRVFMEVSAESIRESSR